MDISFASVPLRTICEDATVAEAAYNADMAATLRSRLADLAAAATVTDLPPVGSPRALVANGQEQYVLDLPPSHALYFCSAHTRTPYLPTGAVDWSQVSRIRLLAIT